MSKLFQHYSDCFGVTVFLFLGSQEEMLKELTKAPVYFNKQSLEDLVCSIRQQDAGLTCELRGEDAVARYLILMPGFDFEIDDYVTLDHEIAHVAHLALLERHIKDLANEDCFHCWLYFHDSLFRAFMTKLNKWREDEKKKKEQEEYAKMIEETAIERVVSNEEESTADVELKKEIENKEKAKKKKKK